jgi:hypothetical protein
VSATYFGQPNFVGEPIAVRHFEPDDVRPMTLGGAPRELAARTINAACSVKNEGSASVQTPCVPQTSSYLRAEPATMSKRNSRHSIGPFHIGTRRDSFRRICLGSFRSGVSTQAVQPA